MLLLLPPSETKRPGGAGAPLAVPSLAFEALAPQREAALDALTSLAADADAMSRALKLSERQRGEVAVNAAVRSAPTMPAIDRFTGVLYDALDAETLPADARRWLGAHAAVQTALLGPVGALDPVPAFRLSAGQRIPGIPPLKRHWAAPTRDALSAATGPIVDLRSEAYRDLGPIPDGTPQAYVRVVEAGADGAVRALNHFNKKTKGAFTRALALAAPEIRSTEELVSWARSAGVDMRPGDAAGELLLVSHG
ncbi:YaaA family protein [Microbacterium karelineae]|uniref:YaaA family protein n=1 Tax=Microbacterium karelineae TaxID=2654283 RepID=UPI0012EA611A|nr:peroxide stress protein YaaA [Microbacterium karelineae]